MSLDMTNYITEFEKDFHSSDSPQNYDLLCVSAFYNLPSASLLYLHIDTPERSDAVKYSNKPMKPNSVGMQAIGSHSPCVPGPAPPSSSHPEPPPPLPHKEKPNRSHSAPLRTLK